MIPYFTVLYLFHLCIAFTGFTFGVADMGIQSLILKYWGNQGMDTRFFILWSLLYWFFNSILQNNLDTPRVAFQWNGFMNRYYKKA